MWQKITVGLIGILILVAAAWGASVYKVNHNLIGGDKDEHGCLIAAGYTWCDYQQECLRPWEKSCNPTAELDITDLFIEKYPEVTAEDISVRVIRSTATHAFGDVNFDPDNLENGGFFFAYLADDKWTLAYDGQAGPNCSDMSALGFPDEILTDFCQPE